MNKKRRYPINKPLKMKIIEHYGTQERFAKAANTDEAIISKLVRKIRKPTEEQAEKISKLLKTPSKELFKRQ